MEGDAIKQITMIKIKYIVCIKHGEVLLNGICDSCREDKLNKILKKNLWSRIRDFVGL